ncbi:ZFP36 [Symbiodinium sp. KB8]|nr:ZFP36 [Symbiodinium sp. KB8]
MSRSRFALRTEVRPEIRGTPMPAIQKKASTPALSVRCANIHQHYLSRDGTEKVEGRCTRGSRCTFAHGIAELRQRPDLYKTKLCASYSLWKQCPYGEDCTHAHGQEELRSVDESVGVFSDSEMQRLEDSKETFSTASGVCDSELSVSAAVNQFGLPNLHEGPMMYFGYDASLSSDGGFPITTPSDYSPPWGSLLHQMQDADLHHMRASPHSNMQMLEFLAANGHQEVAPEYAALRALVLDYFASVRRSVADDHIVFAFDKDMACSEGDVALAEQISLCLGLDAARRAAPQLWSGERPELLELFPELAWFRDTVFLWKMLLLPACECPPVQNWKASDSMLRWQHKKGRFEVHGFGSTKLTPQASADHPGFFQGVLHWFGQYESGKKSLSRASAAVLAGSTKPLQSEDDILFLENVPTFNGEPKEVEEIEGEEDVQELGPGIAIPSLAQLEEVLQAAKLKPCPELVQKSFEGDGAAVAKLLEEGDPNSIWLREERLKGSDGCCQCAISWEEYTPLIAACMEKHDEICELLLRHAATQLNVVCCGLNEFGPYKHFTVIDIARQVKSKLLRRLEEAGALSAAQCPEPPWPRSESEREEAAVVAVEVPAPLLQPPAAAAATKRLVSAMQGQRSYSVEARTKAFKQFMLEWHPDKRPPAERVTATAEREAMELVRCANGCSARLDPSWLAEVAWQQQLRLLRKVAEALGARDSELLLTYLTAHACLKSASNFRNKARALALQRGGDSGKGDGGETFLAFLTTAARDIARRKQGDCAEDWRALDLKPISRSHLATPTGLFFNELMRSPKPLLEAVLCLTWPQLRVAVEKDVGRPDSANEGLILYIVRLAVRVESYLAFVIMHGHRLVLWRSLAGPKDFAWFSVSNSRLFQDSELLNELEVLKMLSDWLRYASKRKQVQTLDMADTLLPAACRAHAHLALIFKNAWSSAWEGKVLEVPPHQLTARDATILLSAQAFLNINHRWLEDLGLDSASGQASATSSLGVGEAGKASQKTFEASSEQQDKGTGHDLK